MLTLSSIIIAVTIFSLTFGRQTVISVFVAIELNLLSVALGLTSTSIYLDYIEPQINSINVICFAAAESALGLALLVQFYRAKGRVDFYFSNILKN